MFYREIKAESSGQYRVFKLQHIMCTEGFVRHEKCQVNLNESGASFEGSTILKWCIFFIRLHLFWLTQVARKCGWQPSLDYFQCDIIEYVVKVQNVDMFLLVLTISRVFTWLLWPLFDDNCYCRWCVPILLFVYFFVIWPIRAEHQ